MLRHLGSRFHNQVTLQECCVPLIQTCCPAFVYEIFKGSFETSTLFQLQLERLLSFGIIKTLASPAHKLATQRTSIVLTVVVEMIRINCTLACFSFLGYRCNHLHPQVMQVTEVLACFCSLYSYTGLLPAAHPFCDPWPLVVCFEARNIFSFSRV